MKVTTDAKGTVTPILLDTAVKYETVYVSSAGDVSIKVAGETTASILKAVPAGSWIPGPITEITTSGTTVPAADMVGYLSTR